MDSPVSVHWSLSGGGRLGGGRESGRGRRRRRSGERCVRRPARGGVRACVPRRMDGVPRADGRACIDAGGGAGRADAERTRQDAREQRRHGECGVGRVMATVPAALRCSAGYGLGGVRQGQLPTPPLTDTWPAARLVGSPAGCRRVARPPCRPAAAASGLSQRPDGDKIAARVLWPPRRASTAG